MIIRCLPLLPLLACQTRSEPTEPTSGPAEVIVRDPTGHVEAQLHAGRPCRSTIGPIELIVGRSDTAQLVAQYGDTRWSGITTDAGTILARDDLQVARVFPTNDPTATAVFDTNGVAMARVQVKNGVATISDGSGKLVRRVWTTPWGIASENPAVLISGTNDLVIAALLASPEILPEVRSLAACERVLTKGAV